MSSKRTIDLRKKKPGIYRELFPLPTLSRKSSSSGGRKSPLRAKRRRTRVLIGLSILTFGVAATWGVGYMTYLPRFAVQTVEVSGADDIRANVLRAYVEAELFDGSNALFSRENIFLYPRRSLEEGIQKYFPRIHSVSISRQSLFAQAIQVTVEERGPKAKWCQGESCYLMDDTGYIFAPETTPSTDLYIVRGSLPSEGSPVGQRFLQDHLSDTFALLESLKRSGFTPKEVAVESGKDFSITLEQGFVLKVSFDEDPERIAHNLELVLSSDALRGREWDLEYLDLRFGNRVYYKFEGSEEVSQ